MPDTAVNPRSIPEIQEAIALLEKWEGRVSDPTAANLFTEAVQLLNDYLEYEPNTPHKPFIQNLKLSNTRRLLQLLKQVDKKDLSTWVEYTKAVFLVLNKEAESAMAAEPELKEEFDSFVLVWAEEYLEVLQQALQRAKQRMT